ncbi:MAG: hypothetical protein CL762_00155 [Chloroflexi bacterium]|nr:hypothetical protein [Chloroflexota bacterium]|tara:strand:- start:4970 stop:5830 length:861 start_codon:yes stop_codon:yes gene_type:complete
MSNKTIVITGSSGGLGLQAAKRIADLDNTVIIASRNEKKGRQVEKEIGKNSYFMQLDVSSIESMDNFVKNFNKKFSKLDILVNNAGIMLHPSKKTKDGTEITFATNYLGYFYLSLKLIPNLICTTNPKIINVSSISSYHVEKINWDYFDPIKKISSLREKREIYEHTNLFRLMFSIELQKRLNEKGIPIKSIACHPGVAKSQLGRYFFLAKLIYALPVMASTEEGIKSIIFSCINPNLNGGEFVGLNKKKQHRGDPIIVKPNPIVEIEEQRNKLWQMTSEKCGINL